MNKKIKSVHVIYTRFAILLLAGPKLARLTLTTMARLNQKYFDSNDITPQVSLL
jgi:hypothetical protein